MNSNLETYLTDKLTEKGIYVFSVTSTDAFGFPLVSITLYSTIELDELLDFLDYKFQCDKSGFNILRETKTVMFSGNALVQLVNKFS